MGNNKKVKKLQNHNSWEIPTEKAGWQWSSVELVSKELNHLAAILHVYVGSLIFMK
jgi:hypothetical protein